MKIVVLQENLVKAVNGVSRVAVVGAKLPILSHILIKASKNELLLSGTDLEISITLKIGAKVDKEGEFTVPAKILAEFLSSLVPGKVEIERKQNKLIVKSGGNKASFQGIEATEFPTVPIDISEEIFNYKKNFDNDLNMVVFAAARESSRPVLNGVWWKKDGKSLRMVATDGYRLSVKRSKAGFKPAKGKKKSEKNKGQIVPAKTLSEVAYFIKSFKHEGGVDVGLTKDKNQVIFKFGDIAITSRLLEGEFPSFDKIIPEKSETVVRFDKEELYSATQMAAIFARDSANIVKWTVSSSGVVVSANSPQVGGNESRVEAKVEGPGGEIAFNSRYLLDLLSVIEADQKEVVFEMGGALAPGLFKISGDDSFIHVIMPVRVQA